MSELTAIIERNYEQAKAGNWVEVLSGWECYPVLARRCSRYSKPGSGWGFLHQAAWFGHEPACRLLISLGAPLTALTHDSCTPADIAHQQGHQALAALLQHAAKGTDSLWKAPGDPDVLPASPLYKEATQIQASIGLLVAYGGGLVRIPAGASCFTDSFGRILVGWHGTFNPPCGMDGESMLTDSPYQA